MRLILQKIIADSGYCSRRQAEKLIEQGVVIVNGKIALKGSKADSGQDKISVRGKLIGPSAPKIYLKLNKPKGYTCTNRKFAGEKNIFELINLPERLFIVGRLDKDSHGLVLLTNDGEMAQKISHPRYNHEKTYTVFVRGKLKNIDLIRQAFLTGLIIPGERREKELVRVKKFRYLQNNHFIITLTEGKKRQLKKMFACFDLEVVDLCRLSLAGLELGDLKDGHFASLNKDEIKKIKI